MQQSSIWSSTYWSCWSFLVQSLGGSYYYVTPIDDATQYVHIYFLKNKSDTIKYLKEFCKLVFNRTNKYPQAITSDRGNQHDNKEWTDYYDLTKDVPFS